MVKSEASLLPICPVEAADRYNLALTVAVEFAASHWNIFESRPLQLYIHTHVPKDSP